MEPQSSGGQIGAGSKSEPIVHLWPEAEAEAEPEAERETEAVAEAEPEAAQGPRAGLQIRLVGGRMSWDD